MRRLTVFLGFCIALLPMWAATAPTPARAQSITSGALVGHVYDLGGSPLFDADVTLENVTTGLVRNAITDRTGRFSFTFLASGEYAVQVEAVGYRPVRVLNVPVGPGRSSPVIVRLRSEPPPVLSVDTITLAGSAADRIRPGQSRWLGSFELSRLPEDDRRGSSVLTLLSDVSGTGGADGLPSTFTGFYLDGIEYRPASTPGGGADPLAGMLVPRSFLSGVEVTRSGTETEFGGSGGATISALTRGGGPTASIDAFADYTGGSLWSSQSLDGDTPENRSLRGGVVASVPIVADSVHAVLGVEAWRLQRPRTGLDGAVAALSGLGSPGGLDAASLEAASVEETNAVAGFGRVDWQVGPESHVSVRAHVLSVPEPEAGPNGYPLLPTDPLAVYGRDFVVGATVQTNFSRLSRLEVKAGLLSSTRTYRASAGQGGFPQTSLASWPLALGTDASLPGTSKVTQFNFSPVVHFDLGEHQLKGGTGVRLSIHEIDQTEAVLGRFLGGDATGVLFGQGFYDRTEGSGLASDFTLPTFFLFGQDVWDAAPGLQVVFGGRLDVDQLPEDDLQRPMVWDSLTVGPVVPFDTVPDVRSFSTKFGFTWDVGETNTTFVQGSAGLAYESLDPFVISQWLTGDGRRMVARDLDPGTWPAAPGSTDVLSPALTIDADYRRPRTTRGSLGLTRAFDSGLALHFSGSYRRTEYLLRKRDLNLTPEPSGVDQFGRPVFGELVQRGGTLGARPSYNRRFPTLDRVYALVTDGWSDYQDLSVAVEKSGGPIRFTGSYTFSRTEDNMVGWGGVGDDPRLVPQTEIGNDGSWDEGISDFDVPHRFVAGVDVALPALPGVHLGAVYRFQSGEAFTPGFRPGVDANGDGSGFNDPAFIGGVDLGSVDAMWSCIRGQSTGPVERNACRGDNVQGLDLRLAIGLEPLTGSRVELIIDALGVIEPELGIRDRALYLVGGGGALSRTGNTYNVPVTANPTFGEFARRLDPGRVLRVGLRIGR